MIDGNRMSLRQDHEKTLFGRDGQMISDLLKGNRIGSVVYAATSVGEGFVEAAILTLFARLALSAVQSENPLDYLPVGVDLSSRQAMYILLGLIAIRGLLGLGLAFLTARIQTQVVAKVRFGLAMAYFESNWTARSRIDASDLTHLIVTLPSQIGNIVSGIISNLSRILVMVVMLSIAFAQDTFLTLSLLLLITFLTLALRPLRRWIKGRARRVMDEQRTLTKATGQTTHLLTEAFAFGVVDDLAKPLLTSINQEMKESRALWFGKATVAPVYTTVTYLAVAAGTAVLFIGDGANLAVIGPVLLVILRSLSYGQGIQAVGVALANVSPALQEIDQKLESLKCAKKITENSAGLPRHESFRKLELRDVSYRYEDQIGLALEGVSLDIPAGQWVSIIGPSGGGKSTLLRLMIGIIEPSDGTLAINERKLEPLYLPAWISRVGYVPQVVNVFEGSVADNVRFFRDWITEDQIRAALTEADLLDEIAALPKGLHTCLGPMGVALSGGQQQRLGLARALVGEPEVLVLDEPTSAIDAYSEQKIAEVLRSLASSKTVLITTHRRHLVEQGDLICVVKDGRVEEFGPPEQLVEEGSYWASLI